MRLADLQSVSPCHVEKGVAALDTIEIVECSAKGREISSAVMESCRCDMWWQLATVRSAS
jgi:hypothetical protein